MYSLYTMTMMVCIIFPSCTRSETVDPKANTGSLAAWLQRFIFQVCCEVRVIQSSTDVAGHMLRNHDRHESHGLFADDKRGPTMIQSGPFSEIDWCNSNF